MTTRRDPRPVYPERFADSMRSLPILSPVSQATRDLSMHCLVRAYWGGHIRAALGILRMGFEAWRIGLVVDVRLAWYRWRGLSEDEIGRRFR